MEAAIAYARFVEQNIGGSSEQGSFGESAKQETAPATLSPRPAPTPSTVPPPFWPGAQTSVAIEHMDAVRAFLTENHLEQYADEFESQGYDDLPFMLTMDADGLSVVADGVSMKPGHKMKFAARMMERSAMVKEARPRS